MSKYLVGWLVAGLLAAWGGTESDVGGSLETFLVDAAHPLPAAQAAGSANRPSLARLNEMLKDLPAGYQVKVSTTLTINLANRQEMVYINHLVRVTAKGVPDGVEYGGGATIPNQVIHWRNGRKHGLEQIYEIGFSGDCFGLIREHQWDDGKLSGECRTFAPATGGSYGPTPPPTVLQSVTTYVNGVQEGDSKSFDAQGRVLRVTPFRQGQRQGVMTDYWPTTGKVKREAPYVAGELEGVVKEYFEDGKLKAEKPFVKGKRHGVERRYQPDGTVALETKWQDDKPVAP